ncbi:MAG: ribosome maturation factor RimP [Oscillospiraceae bacterium]|nr:ribosome maturation factor RimP [Oscillospiraceae bacterium]
MNKIAQRVYDLALPLARELGLELWDVEYRKEAGEWRLRVYIDRAEGYVGIDDCEAFSRAFDPVLDAEDPIEGSYVFEVSSAGAERELKRPSDFERFFGENVEVKLYQARDGQKQFTGTLKAYENGDVTIEGPGGEQRFPAAAVAMVRLRII